MGREVDRHAEPPFMLQLFYRTGAFHRPDEFSATPLPPHISIHTWTNCTLNELSHHLASAPDSNPVSDSDSGPDGKILPDPAIGTRLAFRLIFLDTRGGGASGPRYMVKELGSIVIGDGGPGLDPEDVEARKLLAASGEGGSDGDGEKTLFDARFVVGDYVSCAILPPLEDGSVAPASSARMGRGSGAGEARAAVGRTPAGFRDRDPDRDRMNMFGYGYGYGHGRSGRGRGGGGGRSGRDHDGFGGRGNVPMGEWRRGERLPDIPPPVGRGRGRGRW
ncbi:hypothetical protein F4778DRAFT_425280 [Xylariomycetidae sp. FL2044]|nr:hypothetical protein F4778DRAFT_425280 [Xylariomycetidae sp. FL2044]